MPRMRESGQAESGGLLKTMFLIAGTKVQERLIDSGTFVCPGEGVERPYRHVCLEKKATAYFVPVMKMSDVGEYVECQSCNKTWDPAVLEVQVPQIQSQEELDDALLAAICALATEVVIADGVVNDDERHRAVDIINQYVDESTTALVTVDEFDELLKDKRFGESRSGRSEITATLLSQLAFALNVDGRRTFVRTAYALAVADDEIAKAELKVIKKTAENLGFTRLEAVGIIEHLERERLESRSELEAVNQKETQEKLLTEQLGAVGEKGAVFLGKPNEDSPEGWYLDWVMPSPNRYRFWDGSSTMSTIELRSD